MTSAVLISVAATNMRARPSPWLLATDASLQWEAGVQAWVGTALGRELSRHALIKPLWNRLLRPLEARERAAGTLDPDGELPADRVPTHPLWSALARTLQFESPCRRPAARQTHINILEVRAATASQALSQDPFGLAMDSQVALGGIGKGRSSSQAVYESYLDLMYFPTAENPADDGTRNVPLRAPAEDEPAWLSAAKVGDFELLDRWLADLSATPEDALDLPPLNEIAVIREPVARRAEARAAWWRSPRQRCRRAPRVGLVPFDVTLTERAQQLLDQAGLPRPLQWLVWRGPNLGSADRLLGANVRAQPRRLGRPFAAGLATATGQGSHRALLLCVWRRPCVHQHEPCSAPSSSLFRLPGRLAKLQVDHAGPCGARKPARRLRGFPG